jgi:hypothetical protein
MAAWLLEQNGRRMDRTIALSLCNAAMCGAAFVLVAAYRVMP